MGFWFQNEYHKRREFYDEHHEGDGHKKRTSTKKRHKKSGKKKYKKGKKTQTYQNAGKGAKGTTLKVKEQKHAKGHEAKNGTATDQKNKQKYAEKELKTVEAKHDEKKGQ